MQDINIWAVVVSAVVSMVIGFLWYGPLFGKAWAKERGLDPNGKMNGSAGPAYAQQFIGALLMAYVFAHVLVAFESDSVATALEGSFWMWLGFVVPVKYGEVLWGKASKKLFFIDAIHYLVLLAAFAVVLTLWK